MMVIVAGRGEGVQFGMGTAGPTDLQRHTLVCALEVLLKEAQPSGMGGLIRRSPLGDSLTNELIAFHASVLRWPHLLDFPASVKQVQLSSPFCSYLFPHSLLHIERCFV